MESAADKKRLLAINFGGLGDEVLFLPTLKSIKLEHPSWHITLLTEPRARSIADVTDVIDGNITFDIKKKPLKPADYAHLLGLLRSGNFDLVVSSGSSPLVAMLLFLSGIKQRIGYATSAVAKLLLTNPVTLTRNQHAVFMYHDLVKGLDIGSTAQCPEVTVNQENVQRMRRLLPKDGGVSAGRRILLHPGTSKLALEKGIIKTWDPQNFAHLIVRLLQSGAEVVLAGGPEDEQTVLDIQSKLPDAKHPNLLLAYGKTASLRDLVALIELCDLMICVDSAPMHLGVGRNKPMVALFGPTDPAKLLWPAKHFVSLRDQQAAAAAGDDPFKNAAKKRSESSPPRPPFVQIPLDTVFQTAMDLLKSIEAPENSQESRRS